jgi:mono/diheme cytochrome c family protein
MKRLVALALAGSVAASLSGPILGGDAKGGVKDVARPNAWGDTPAPYFRPTGKRPSAAIGEQVFLDHCAICHGLHGKGDGPRSAFFVAGQQYIADLSNADVVSNRDPQLLESIREGLRRFPEPAYVMPQFKYILSEDEIQSVLLYVKTLPKLARR